jgi:hypothetical protein
MLAIVNAAISFAAISFVAMRSFVPSRVSFVRSLARE